MLSPLSEKLGEVRMAELLEKLRRERGENGAVSVREKPPFMQQFSRCETHGQYPRNMLDERGIERWLPEICPHCAKQQQVTQLMRRAAVSLRFEGCTFDNYRTDTEAQRTALETCRAYADGFADVVQTGRSLILRGNPGTGKNHLATAITRRVMEAGWSVLNVTAYELIGRIRETWRDRSESEADVTARFGTADLLIIDEVGRQHGTDSERIQLFNVIDQRYRAMRPTVVISNCTPSGIREFLGDATYDRLREGGGQLVNFDWVSYRAQAADHFRGATKMIQS